MAFIIEGGALMLRHADMFQARQRARFMRPDADRWLAPPHPDERKYSPSQPRDWRGRWTDGGGGSGGDSASPMGQIDFGDLPSFSDLFGLFQIAPTESDAAGQQFAGDERQGYPVDLLEERELGGHAIERHVGRSADSLLNDVRQAQRYSRETGYSEGLRVGSFSSLQSANKLVNSTLSQNAEKVDSVATGLSPREELDGRFGSSTGSEAYARNERSQVRIRETYGVRAVIVRDRNSSKGYRVDTAFPMTPED